MADNYRLTDLAAEWRGDADAETNVAVAEALSRCAEEIENLAAEEA